MKFDADAWHVQQLIPVSVKDNNTQIVLRFNETLALTVGVAVTPLYIRVSRLDHSQADQNQ